MRPLDQDLGSLVGLEKVKRLLDPAEAPTASNPLAARSLLGALAFAGQAGRDAPGLVGVAAACLPTAAGRHALAFPGHRDHQQLRLSTGTTIQCCADAHFDYAFIACRVRPVGTPDRQTEAVFADLESAVRRAGMAVSDLVRTWFFLDGIGEWYDAFNRVRTAVFTGWGLDRMPASTGVGAPNPTGAALAVGALAAHPRHHGAAIHPVASPGQCPAMAYRSSFSRAMLLECPDYRHLMVSGTASIGEGGESRHDGDLVAQTGRTVAVIDGLLRSQGMGWRHVERAIAYAKRRADCAGVHAALGAVLPPSARLLTVHADICRPELLMEVEVDAVTGGAC